VALRLQVCLKWRDPSPNLERESVLEADSVKDWKSPQQALAVPLLPGFTNETKGRRKLKLPKRKIDNSNAVPLAKGRDLQADLLGDHTTTLTEMWPSVTLA
jgi:hypothetical protein